MDKEMFKRLVYLRYGNAEAFAKEYGTTRQNVRAFWKEGRRWTTPAVRKRLAKALDLSASEYKEMFKDEQ